MNKGDLEDEEDPDESVEEFDRVLRQHYGEDHDIQNSKKLSLPEQIGKYYAITEEGPRRDSKVKGRYQNCGDEEDGGLPVAEEKRLSKQPSVKTRKPLVEKT